ncbi:hypothetical protein ACXD9I_003662 [Yersinia enterocolitica]
MNHLEELKKAALNANLHGWTGFEDALNADGYSEAVSKFIGHCSPSEILALIAQLEAAQKEIDTLKVWKKIAAGRYENLQEIKSQLEKAEAALSATNEKLLVPVAKKLAPVAEVVSKFGDPEAFGEREIKLLIDLRGVPYGTQLFTAAKPGALPRYIFSALVNELRDVPAIGCKRELIIGVLNRHGVIADSVDN